MRVILKDNIENLGNVGDVVEVKRGYARNYLLPKGLVLVADEGNVKAWEHQQRVIADRIRKLRLSAEQLAKQLDGQKVEIQARAGEGDRLFGSVGSTDIQKALRGKGFQVPRKDIQLARPIKALGVHKIKVKLHPEVVCNVEVEVTRSPDSPPIETKKSKTAEILETAAREEEAARAAREAEEASEGEEEEAGEDEEAE